MSCTMEQKYQLKLTSELKEEKEGSSFAECFTVHLACRSLTTTCRPDTCLSAAARTLSLLSTCTFPLSSTRRKRCTSPCIAARWSCTSDGDSFCNRPARWISTDGGINKCNRVLLEKLTIAQSVNKLPAFCGRRSYFTMLLTARHRSLI